jgi:hypothetical protein
MVPEIDKAEVLREGGIPDFPVGLRAGLGGSFARCWEAVNGVVPILEIIFMTLLETRADRLVNNDTQMNLLLVNVIHGFAVAIVIEIYLYKCLRILTEPREHPKYNCLLLQSGRSHLEDRDENLVQKDLNFFLYVHILDLITTAY